MTDENQSQIATGSNLIQFPTFMADALKTQEMKTVTPKDTFVSPIYDSMMEEAKRLDLKSSYKSELNYGIYRDLEMRFKDKPMRGGILYNNPFKLANSNETCQQCLYSF